MTSDTIRTDYVYCGAFTAKRFGALAALIAQNTALVLVTKFSFSRGVLTPYLVSTVVACSESLKFIVSCALLTNTHGKGAAISAMRDLRSNGARLALPSALYVIQNNLLFKAVRLLSPTMYMVCSQSKILTSALFSVLLLNSRITRRQCLALMTLVVGMILVNASEGEGQSASLRRPMVVVHRAVFWLCSQRPSSPGSPVRIWRKCTSHRATGVLILIPTRYGFETRSWRVFRFPSR